MSDDPVRASRMIIGDGFDVVSVEGTGMTMARWGTLRIVYEHPETGERYCREYLINKDNFENLKTKCENLTRKDIDEIAQ